MSPASKEPSPLIKALQAATKALTYPSDSDEPFEAFEWDAKGASGAKDQITAHTAKGRKLEEVPVDVFFEQLDAADDDEDRYRRLRQVLQSLLSGLKVFRVGAGEVRVDIYLIGVTHAGDWAGLHTVSVET